GSSGSQDREHACQRVGVDGPVHGQTYARWKLDPDLAGYRLGQRYGRCRRPGNFDLGERWQRRRLYPGQLARHRLPPPCVELALARIANRSTRSERIPQDHQLLLHRPAPPARYPADDLDPSAHTTARMTTRSISLAIVQLRRSQKERQSAHLVVLVQDGRQTTLTSLLRV